MKIQILISKNSWANKYRNIIINKLKKYYKKVEILQTHKKLKKDYNINIIFSYFEIIPKKYLARSQINLIPHESDLPQGKGMSPLSWQILQNLQKIVFSLIEADEQVDSGKIYYKKKVLIPKHYLFDEIKKTQLSINLKLIEKFILHYKKKLTVPNSIVQLGKSSFYKRRSPNDSKINIKKSIEEQFNLFRVVDNQSYPAFFKIHKKKYFLKISKSSFYKIRSPKITEIDINKSIEEQFNLFRVVDNQSYLAFFKIHNKKYFLKINRLNHKVINKNTELKIRYANIEDLHFILKLYNQNVLKGKFFSKKKALLKEHEIWFKDKVNKKMLFISSLLKEKIGYIRFDYIDKKNLSISIAVKENYKRRGLGKQMLTKTLKRKKISKFNIFALIKKQNLISKKFFLNLGFKFLKENIYILKN